MRWLRAELEAQQQAWAAEQERKRARKYRPICGARRTGGCGECQSTALYPNGRCRVHGGPSTGPRTPEGKARALTALRAINAERTRRRGEIRSGGRQDG